MAKRKTEVDKIRARDRKQYENNRKKILATQEVCALCGNIVDKNLPAGHPWSAEIDHKIPVSRGGSSDLENLQLTHRKCNRAKWDNYARAEKAGGAGSEQEEIIDNRNLPWSVDWLHFHDRHK